jgi:hypothetical protein
MQMTSILRNSFVALGLAGTFIAGGALGYPQTQSKRRPLEFVTPPDQDGNAAKQRVLGVLSGEDLGFRVESQKANAVVGRFVVRVYGQWVDVEAAFAPKVLTTAR